MTASPTRPTSLSASTVPVTPIDPLTPLTSLNCEGSSSVESTENGVGNGLARAKSKKEKYFEERNEKNIFKKILHPNYYERSRVFKKLFVDKCQLDENDAFLASYSCAYQREILAQGRMYISQTTVCFHANIIGWETTLAIPMSEIKEITKQRAAYIFPNSIQIERTSGEKMFFASFYNRDKSIQILQSALDRYRQGNRMTPEEVWELLNKSEDKSTSKSSLNSPVEHSTNTPDTSSSSMTILKSRSDKDTSSQSSSSRGSVEFPDDECYQFDEAPATCSQEPDSSAPTCPCDEHPGRLLLDTTFPVSIGRLYALLFTDNPWFDKFSAEIKHHGYVASAWTRDKSGEESRTCTYTVELNHAMAPKNCVANEKQVLTYFASRDDGIVVFKETQNSGVPYADNFVVQCTYCISRVSANSCRVKVHGGIHYKRNIWSIIRGYIEKGTNQGLDEHYQILERMLTEECARINSVVPKEDDVLPTISPEFEIRNRRQNSTKPNRLAAGGENEKLIVERKETGVIRGKETVLASTGSASDLRPILIGILAVLVLFLISNYLVLRRLSDAVDGGTQISELRTQLGEIREQLEKLMREK